MSSQNLRDKLFTEVILPSFYGQFGANVVAVLLLESFLPEEERTFVVEQFRGITVVDVYSVYETSKMYRLFMYSDEMREMSLSYGPKLQGENVSLVCESTLYKGPSNLQSLMEAMYILYDRLMKTKESHFKG